MANYLYNGVEFPELPEWDEETYPYRFINVNNSTGAVTTTLLTQPVYQSGTVVLASADCIRIRYSLVDGAWAERSETEISTGVTVTFSGTIHWTNRDIYDSDGSLYLAASDPIPVSGSIPEQTFLGMLLAQFGVIPHVMGKGGFKELTGYLFEGVDIDIPLAAWDMVKYPYARLWVGYVDGEPVYKFNATSAIGEIIEEDGTARYRVYADDYVFNSHSTSGIGPHWTWKTWAIYRNGVNYHDGYIAQDLSRLCWSNHDILNADGTVYRSASKLIPVYET